MPATARWPRYVVMSAAFTLTLLATAVPADAHPYGYPQTVTITADAARPDVVHQTWKAGGVDELTLRGVHVDLLLQDRVTLHVATSHQPSDATALAPSAPFANYLIRQMTVSGAGQACTSAVGRASGSPPPAWTSTTPARIRPVSRASRSGCRATSIRRPEAGRSGGPPACRGRHPHARHRWFSHPTKETPRHDARETCA